MSYNVTLNKKLPEQGVYDQLLGGHVEDRKLMKLYPRSGSGPFSPYGNDRIEFRLPDHGHVDTLRSYMSYTLRVTADMNNQSVMSEVGAQTDDTADTLSSLRNRAEHGMTQYFRAKTFDNDPHFDTHAYILGGFNGSTASVFRRFRLLIDNEQIEDIEQYHGLAAMLNMNIPDTYRSSAAGHMQFLHPRGGREMVLNALQRGGSNMLRHQSTTRTYGYDNSPGLTDMPQSDVKTTAGTFVTTEYKDLMHLPVSGIMSNPKLLPSKFMPPTDLEFTLAPVHEALQVVNGQACNKLISSYVGAYVRCGAGLRFRGVGATTSFENDVASNSTYDILPLLSSENAMAKYTWAAIGTVLQGGTLNQKGVPLLTADKQVACVVNDKFQSSVRYEIVDPVYHVEVVYMSKQYDSAFADALTRGITYSYDTYAYTNTTIKTSGIAQVPLTKTSVKGILSGFVNSTVQHGLLTNHWHYVNPDLDTYQFRFGSKLIPQEPVHVHDSTGLESLMLYLKSVGMHYEMHAGLNFGWSQGLYDTRQCARGTEPDVIATDTVNNVFGSSEPGPATWCYGTGRTPRGGDITKALGTYAATADLDKVDVVTNYISTPSNLGGNRVNVSYAGLRLSNALSKHSKTDLLRCLYSFNIGSFVLGLDLEAEQGTLSGINSSGSTAMMEWNFVFKNEPNAPMHLYTWLRHDKAIRLEPMGKISILVD